MMWLRWLLPVGGVEGSSCGESSVFFLPEGMDVECLVCREVSLTEELYKRDTQCTAFWAKLLKGKLMYMLLCVGVVPWHKLGMIDVASLFCWTKWKKEML